MRKKEEDVKSPSFGDEVLKPVENVLPVFLLVLALLNRPDFPSGLVDTNRDGRQEKHGSEECKDVGVDLHDKTPFFRLNLSP